MNLKKILSAFMACAVMGTAVPVSQATLPQAALTASATEEYTEGTYGVLTYKNYGDHIEISGCETSATEVEIPEEIDGLPVTVIGDYAFFGCSALTSVTIPDSVTSISLGAFISCSSLKSISLPENLETIGDMAFSNCDGLIQITIPDSVTYIGKLAFTNCYALENITLPDNDGGTIIDEGAFCNCSALYDVTIPKGVTKIGDCTFSNCTNLKTITILNPDCNIDEKNNDGGTISNGHEDSVYYFTGTIYGYEGSTAQTYAEKYGYTFSSLIDYREETTGVLTYRIYSDHVEIVDCDASATEVVIPDEIDGLPVTVIERLAFFECLELNSVIIPDSITEIAEMAFYACPSLTSISIPHSITSIGSSVFTNCTNLTEINVDEYNEYYSSEDGVLFNKYKTHLIQYPCGKKGAYTISDGIASIETGAFSYCESLTNVTIPDTVTSIPYRAFWYCHELTSITIPDSVSQIGEYAFSLCLSLTDITILNPGCQIYDAGTTINNSMDTAINSSETIYGYAGSTAQEYAEKYGRTFVTLSNEPMMGPTEDGGFVFTYGDGSYTYYDADDIKGSAIKPTLTVDTVESEAGAEVTVAVSVSTGDWANSGIHVNYDTDNLTLINAAWSDEIRNCDAITLKTLNEYDGGVFFTTAGTVDSGVTEYAVLTFEVNQNAQSGDFYPVTIDYVSKDEFSSPQLYEITERELMTAYTFTYGIVNGGVHIPEEDASDKVTTTTTTSTTITTTTTTTTTASSSELMIIPASLTMTPGDTNTLLVINAPDGASIQWTSDNTGVVTVADGVVAAVGEGTATIYAVCGNSVATCKVTVGASGIIYGDADCDGEVGIADVVKIMTHFTTPGGTLSDEGINNADVYQRGDGIGNMDALAVQKKIAQLITELPESYM